jgi:DNA (cytosine-5)-methyltransferase 1
VKVLSLFSGVGGFDLGLENAGMETVFQCEWDKHATKILERHWPHVPRWDDVSTLTGEHILRHAPVIDVVAWGSPCQDLSVAGKRAGLQGARSGLFHEGVRIIKELRSLTNGKYPRISIWENVAGALSSGAGADFGQVLTEMDEAGACFSEWRILDAQYFGVPQRRRRVFLISVFDTATAARCPDPLLPVSEGVQWHPQTSNQARQTVTGETPTSTRSRGAIIGSDIVGPLAASDWKFPQQQQVHENKCVVETFTKGKRPQTSTDDETWDENRPAPTINAFDQGDTRATTVIVEEPVLLTMREGKPGGGKGPLLSTDKSLSLRTGNEQTLFQPNEEPVLLDGTRVDDVRVYDPPVQTLKSRMGTGGNNVPVIGFSHTQGLSAQPSEDAWPTLRTEGNGMAVAYDEYNDSLGGEVHHALRAGTKQSTGVMVEPVEPVMPTLLAGMSHLTGTTQDAYIKTINSVSPTMAVRRLTPLECERLMGWPDDWTAGQSDTHRYKQCGNGVASPVAQWIGEILIATDSATATDA